MSKEYRFSIEKNYVVQADNYDEALDLLNSEKEYSYVVDENVTYLSEKEGK